MDSSFYLALFNKTTWDEFLSSGAHVYGTKKTKDKRAKLLKPNDFLICYISKLSIFSGILKVNSDSYYDTSPIWKGDEFPIRLKVDPIIILNIDDGLPVKNFLSELEIFYFLLNPNKWMGFFLNSLNRFPDDDGIIIMNELDKKMKEVKLAGRQKKELI